MWRGGGLVLQEDRLRMKRIIEVLRRRAAQQRMFARLIAGLWQNVVVRKQADKGTHPGITDLEIKK